jgi:hypothetical protein
VVTGLFSGLGVAVQVWPVLWSCFGMCFAGHWTVTQCASKLCPNCVRILDGSLSDPQCLCVLLPNAQETVTIYRL